MKTKPFSICLWFDKEAEQAAKFYTDIFDDGKVGKIQRYGKEGFEFHGQPEGSVMVVDFKANGQHFQALNGGPQFKFNESISLVITCKDQKEIDYFWKKLTAKDGKEVQCGWLTDRFGLSWQVIPTGFAKMMDGTAGGKRAMNAMFTMKKFDIKKLEKAYKGK